jgi:hypothetical protein
VICFEGRNTGTQHHVKDCLAYAAKLEDEMERSVRCLGVGLYQAMLQLLWITGETATEKCDPSLSNLKNSKVKPSERMQRISGEKVRWALLRSQLKVKVSSRKCLREH